HCQLNNTSPSIRPSLYAYECIHGEHFISREIMRATVFNYIECDYNRWRRHSWCGGLSPEQFENQNLA
ncbi:IS3 family transposase, partial [Escherichia coli]|uniref:IS3 family transposase n=1 Tax=Escherichia coli TaxID=562 RepID=UPI0012FFC0A7